MGAPDGTQAVWLSAAHLPQPASFTSLPWEHRHLCEVRGYATGTIDSRPQLADCKGSPQIRDSFQLNSIREDELLNSCMNALQGNPTAVAKLEFWAKVFSCQTADRSLHRLSTLWQRSASTKAIGKMLSDIAQAGHVRCQLDKFVDFFLKPKDSCAAGCVVNDKEAPVLDTKKKRKGKLKTRHSLNPTALYEEDLHLFPPYSLVNQAFARAVKSILQGHVAALNTLLASASLRRAADSPDSLGYTLSENVGAVIGLPSGELTLLELHLHTSNLRLQLQVLASLCLIHFTGEKRASDENFTGNGEWPMEGDLAIIGVPFDSSVPDFSKFLKGVELLTFLYTQLKEADVIHVELLRYLFSCACQPYLTFIQTWLYSATVKDPYKEFIVEESAGLVGSATVCKPGERCPSTYFKVRESASVPCFLMDICIPLIRAGHQLQVLLKLAESGNFAEGSSGLGSSSCEVGVGLLQDALKYWTDVSCETSVFGPVLVFNKEKLNELIQRRERVRFELMQKFDMLFSNFNLLREVHTLQMPKALKQQQSWKVTSDTDSTRLHGNGNDNKGVQDSMSVLSQRNFQQEEFTQAISGMELEEEDVAMFSAPCEQVSDPDSEIQMSVHSADTSVREDLIKAESAESNRSGEFSRNVDVAPFSNSNSAKKQRRRWKEPFDVIIVHGKSEGDAGSITMFDDDNLKATLTWNASGLADCFGKVHNSYGRLFISPPMSSSFACEGTSNHCEVFSCLEMDHSSGMLMKGDDKNVNQLTVKADRGSLSQLDSFSFFFPEVCLEKIGPEKFFGVSLIRKLAQKYSLKHPDKPLKRNYINSFVNFNVISHEFSNFEACLFNTTFELKLLPEFSSVKADTVEKLDLAKKDSAFQVTEEFSATGQCHSENFIKGHLNPGNWKNKLSDATFQLGPTGCPENPADSTKQSADVTLADCALDNSLDIGHIHAAQKSEKLNGGGTWESYLMGTEEQEATDFEENMLLSEKFEVPLEIVIDNCIIQEVLSQYHCISYFTVRLLHEIFRLQDHLIALRRYFFMERGDWADYFTIALYQNAWYPTESQQRQLEVQAILEAALQNSSCEDDEYAERLHVCISGHGHSVEAGKLVPDVDKTSHIYVNKNCVSAFDFIMLEYQVAWPINLILTPDSFQLYNSIFSFLVRTKLTAHALSDVWQCLKILSRHSKGMTKNGGLQNRQERIRVLILFRQQIAHFITTLQGYVEAQLLHNSWSTFLYAFYYEAEDLQDLEAIHKRYLKEALHQCFLSDEMQPVKVCIDDIMQCLLSLSFGLRYSGKQTENGELDIENDQIYGMVLEAKTQYENCIQKLHQLSCHSHNQEALTYFWTRLNFNDFLGDTCPKLPKES